MNRQPLSSSHIGNILGISLVAGYAILFILLLFRVLLVFTYDGEIGGIDNNFVYGVAISLAGMDLYPDPAAMPYSVNPYSPLYYNICALVGRLVGTDPAEPITVYRLCRSVSLACDIATCFILFSLLHRKVRLRKELSLLAVAAFGTLLCFLGYTFSRADSLLLLFYALLMYKLFTLEKSRLTDIVLISFLSVCCVFSKQNGIVTPLLCVAWLWISGMRMQILWYSASTIIIFIAAWIFYTRVLGFAYLFDHTVRGINNRIDFSWFYVDIFKRFASSLMIIPLFLGFSLSVKYLFEGKAGWKTKSIAAVFLLQLAFSLATSLKWGASAGYFNESFFLSFIVIAMYASGISNENAIKKFLAFSLPLGILFFVHVILQGYLFFIQKQDEKKIHYEHQKTISAWLAPRLTGTRVLDLGNQNTNFFKVFLYKQTAVPNFDAVNCCTLPDGNFDYGALKADLQNGNIGYILVPEQEKPAELWGVSLDKYQKDTVLFGQAVYTFRPNR